MIDQCLKIGRYQSKDKDRASDVSYALVLSRPVLLSHSLDHSGFLPVCLLFRTQVNLQHSQRHTLDFRVAVQAGRDWMRKIQQALGVGGQKEKRKRQQPTTRFSKENTDQVTDIACVGRVLAKNSCFGEGHRKKRHAVCGLKTTMQTTGQKHKQPVSRHRFFIVLSSFCIVLSSFFFVRDNRKRWIEVNGVV